MPRTVKQLQSVHPSYDAARVGRYRALYLGGDEFRRRIDQFLIRRRSEERRIKALGQVDLYAERAKWAQYINRAGGLIDWFRAAVFPGARIVVENAEDERADYWIGLTDDADGRGRPLVAVLREVLAHALVQGRAYLRAHFPAPEARAAEPSTYAVEMRPLPPGSVIDWESAADDDEDLDWIKTYSCRVQRAAGDAYDSLPAMLHRWTVITETEVRAYYAMQPAGVATLDDDLEVQAEAAEHDFGALPVFAVRVTPDQWVMDRVADVAVALYNAEAALSYALMLQAYAQPVFHLDASDLSRVVANEANAIRLDPGEKFEYVTPPANVFDPLAKNIERLKSAFYEVLQALAINAASIPQAGRLSGQAVDAMRSPMQVMISSFRAPVMDAARRWVRAVQAYRGDDDLQIEIEIDDGAGSPDPSQLGGILDGPQIQQPAQHS